MWLQSSKIFVQLFFLCRILNPSKLEVIEKKVCVTNVISFVFLHLIWRRYVLKVIWLLRSYSCLSVCLSASLPIRLHCLSICLPLWPHFNTWIWWWWWWNTFELQSTLHILYLYLSLYYTHTHVRSVGLLLYTVLVTISLRFVQIYRL